MVTSKLRFRDWGSIHADLAFIYEGEVAECFRDCEMPENFLGAWLILEGRCRLTQGPTLLEAGAGEWIIMRRARGWQYFSADARILSIRFEAEWPDRKPFFDLGLGVKFAAARFPRLEASSRHLLDGVRRVTPRTTVDLRAESLALSEFLEIRSGFLSWFTELCATLEALDIHPSRTMLRDERIAKVLYNLSRLPFSSRFREEELAASVGLQVGQFVRVFRREVGTTPKRFFDDRRRDACRRLLANTDMPIKEIALELGYMRLSDFSAWFSAHEGISPRDFRRRFRDSGRPMML